MMALKEQFRKGVFPDFNNQKLYPCVRPQMGTPFLRWPIQCLLLSGVTVSQKTWILATISVMGSLTTILRKCFCSCQSLSIGFMSGLSAVCGQQFTLLSCMNFILNLTTKKLFVPFQTNFFLNVFVCGQCFVVTDIIFQGNLISVFLGSLSFWNWYPLSVYVACVKSKCNSRIPRVLFM